LLDVRERGGEFELNLLGERYGELPEGAPERLERLTSAIRTNGFAATRADYVRTLGECDLVVSTSRHEFFGVAVVEALAAGCTPLLPARLAYPEIVPEALHALALYGDEAALRRRLLEHCRAAETLRTEPARARWSAVAARHDARSVARRLDEVCRQALESRV
jgi:glycosyltransferase involved in cell wall biosynthesis